MKPRYKAVQETKELFIITKDVENEVGKEMVPISPISNPIFF